MSFLKRRKSGRRPVATGTLNIDSAYDDRLQPSPAPSIKSTSDLRKRLSSFSSLISRSSRSQPPQPRATASGGVAFIAPPGIHYAFEDNSPLHSPEPSLEIRRPSGLGRRASLSEGFAEEWIGEQRRLREAEQKPSVSVPDLIIFPNGLVKWVELSDEEEDDEDVAPEPLRVLNRVPIELLNTLFLFMDSSSLASLAQVCRRFTEPARISLYRDLDFSNDTTDVRFNSCMNILASRRDFAQLVKRLVCPLAPASKNLDGSVSLPAVTFALALNGMAGLTSLTLPRYDAPILFHTTFHLKKLSFTCDTATTDELRDTLAWIASQPGLTSLSFPNLVLDHDSIKLLAMANHFGQPEDHDEETCATSTPSTFTFSRDFLPHLKHLNGPISLVSALTPGRPLTSLTVRIHNTIYDGLRPSALMAKLALSSAPVTRLAVITSLQNRVDARTSERVLMSAGAELGSHIKHLEIQSTLDDEVLYKHLLSVLSRYRSLHSLCLSHPFLPAVTTSSAPSMFGISLSSFPLPTPPATPVRIRPDVALSAKTLERATLGAWNKHCPTLRSVLFPSSGQWRIAQGTGGPIFTFTGYATF